MNTVVNALREVVGQFDFYIENGNYNGTWDYGLMLEYVCGVIVVLVVISAVFKFLNKLFD